TAAVLAGFAAGLPAFVLIKVFSPAFFAREDTRTPMWLAAVAVLLNTVGSLLLFPRFGALGIAIATSAAAWLNAVLLAWRLVRRGHWTMDARLRRVLPRLLLAALAMGAAAHAAAGWAAPWLAGEGLRAALALAAICVGGAVLYGLACHALRAIDVGDALAALRGRTG
ncbi:MAG: polysaccharide biosynthesis C-terminal domain-containing protein, partial [Rhizobiales bacterium]|nr:polysaccharide biosynthesis C-terminal domain-containing protein [Hyphomicrobiales bacterium]